MKGTNSNNETMDRTVPVEPVGSNSGFRVVEVQQRVKPQSLKHDPLDHGVDNPDKSSSSSSEDDSDDEEPLITNNTQIHINTGSSVKTAPDPSAKKPEATANANKKQFIRVKLNNKWSKDRWEITDKVPNEGDGIRHAASGKDINVVRRVELKHEVGKNSTPKSPELVNKAPEFGPAMKPSTISLITILDGFAKVKEQNHGQIDVDGAKSKSPAGEPREAPEKVISKVASPVKELEEKAKDENQVPRNQLREAPQPQASENYEPRPKPDKKIFDQKRTVPTVAVPVRVDNDEPVRQSNETICKITEFFDYGKKIMLTMIEEESKSKDQLINDLINELNSLKEANGLALSLMTPEQREKYDKEQVNRSRTRRVLREEPPKRANPSDHRQNPRLNGHPQNQIVQQVTSENKHQQKTTAQKTKGNPNKTPLSANPNGNNATQLQHRGYNGLPPAQQGELPQTSTHAHMAPDPNQQYTPVTVNPANYVRNNLGQYQYIHPHHTVPVQRPNPPQQGQPNNHYHQQNNGLHGLHVNFSSMSSSPHLWNGPTK